jgi:hypothetical protein
MAGYVSPKISVRPMKIGLGSILMEPVAKDELLVDFEGRGIETGEDEAWIHERDGNPYVIQVDDRVYLVSNLGDPMGIDYFNHSCHSNTGMRGSYCIVARRDIEAGEELTLDYALAEMHAWYAMDCQCGEARCRGVLTGRDWRDEGFREEYAGYFSEHIQRRMDLNPMQALARDAAERLLLGMKWSRFQLRRIFRRPNPSR